MRRHWLGEAEHVDTALYAAVARPNIPTLDRAMKRVSDAANHSRLWMATAGTRHVRMPRTLSFPSGHAASTFAFATEPPGPNRATPCRSRAHPLVAYSRVHPGSTVPAMWSVSRSLLGISLAQSTTRVRNGVDPDRPRQLLEATLRGQARARQGGLYDLPDGNTRDALQAMRTSGREVGKVVRATTPTHEHLRSRLLALFFATILLDVVASMLIFMFERHRPGTEITNFGDSVFWTSTQLLTVSSQLPNPLSTPARVLDVFLQAFAISAVAILAGSFGAFFHRRGLERDPLAVRAPTAGEERPPHR